MSPSLPRSGAIAFAECASSVTSLAAVWFIGRNGHAQIMQPVRDFIAERLLPHTPPVGETAAQKQARIKNAQSKASAILKGVIMVSVGFATHIPTQMFLEGKFHFGEIEELKQVLTGKSLGLLTVLVSLGVTEKASPGITERVESKIIESLGLEPKGKTHHAGEDPKIGEDDFRKLTFIEVPSSVVSGLVNYYFTRIPRR